MKQRKDPMTEPGGASCWSNKGHCSWKHVMQCIACKRTWMDILLARISQPPVPPGPALRRPLRLGKGGGACCKR
eukprot:365555-Chlamydomonas_euryale.AAC.3